MQISEADKLRLKQIASLIEKSKMEEARSLLTDLLHKSPNLAPAWYLISFTVTDTSRKLAALGRAISIDPNYAPAQKALEALSSTAKLQQAVHPQRPAAKTNSDGKVPLSVALLVVVLVLLVVGGGVFFVVRPSGVADVKTLVADIRATPVGTPLVFSTTEVRGETTVEIHAHANDRQSNWRTDFTVRGSGSYRKADNALSFYVEDARTSEFWEFRFLLPSYSNGTTYEDGLTINVSYVIGYLSADRVSRETIRCPEIKANYKIEQQNKDFVITLSRTCSNDPQQWLDAVIRFKPTEALTPTPTIAPELVFDYQPWKGRIRLEMNSAAGDRIGDGKGDILVDTLGELRHTGESAPYAYTFIAATETDRWELSFWSPSIQLQQPYEVYHAVRYSNHGNSAEMKIEHPVRGYPVTYIAPCTQAHGRFTVEQQAPTIVIAFEQSCGRVGETLRGRLIFTPDLDYATPTMTPTVTPIPRYSPIPPSDQIFPTWTPMPNVVGANGTSTISLNDLGDLRLRKIEINMEWIGRETRFQTLQGLGNTATWPYQFDIRIRDNNIRESWHFKFQGEDILIGQTYHYSSFADAEMATVTGMQVGQNYEPICKNIDGYFRFDRQGDYLVVTFTQRCIDNALMSLQGTIRMSPD